MDPSSITILFIPGAWHSAQCFADVANRLQKSGFNTDLVELPSVGAKGHHDDFSSDVAMIRDHASKAISVGQKIVLVAHSYGGVPTTEAIRDFSSHVVHFVLVCSFLLQKDASVLSTVGGEPLPWWGVSPDKLQMNAKTPKDIFYDDISQEEADIYISNLKPHSYKAFQSRLTYEGWRHVPTTYLYCTLDAALPIAAQRRMVQETAKGVNIRTEELNTGHSPFFKSPAAVADMIERAVGLRGS
ncbi:hypothetical protein FSARC_8701 [Fusarium sarcochroum]|uniref:AB hydrolase-1 domain-containing protein n=1 Tax=Fusarium sarcochroum TaxID=1208366 RepID=A0A8H4TSN6_9HYPO|nr:hypothetical protein FSARC_8701 [Fusarium sarcochroum]